LLYFEGAAEVVKEVKAEDLSESKMLNPLLIENATGGIFLISIAAVVEVVGAEQLEAAGAIFLFCP
jgi:hypothetical protein